MSGHNPSGVKCACGVELSIEVVVHAVYYGQVPQCLRCSLRLQKLAS